MTSVLFRQGGYDSKGKRLLHRDILLKVRVKVFDEAPGLHLLGSGYSEYRKGVGQYDPDRPA